VVVAVEQDQVTLDVDQEEMVDLVVEEQEDQDLVVKKQVELVTHLQLVQLKELMVEKDLQELKPLKVDLVVVVVEQRLPVHNQQQMELPLQLQVEQVQHQVLMELQQQEQVVAVVVLMLVDH
tara:strand:+ start:360 stop:725 length:366 start_codon:yes stop_codon:yes gene_type:complete